ncbi:beta-ketoacyl-ACP synthase III [Chitinophaga japonensis]|uniref:Beta-ketoacyl-[acyl-carrier-protein] synthase III n=1 Tax=Chitinophaga japonensis TaxID=104662 RepID=A0A562T0X7_CHIJA|nr:beta-ketoacyl-ACP synthase III [Chitinophaga japonensis]TWI86696.1 3-oxoacyl-[acyl-carrier-protein] synthase-3 [Chitinophaga japonensis]
MKPITAAITAVGGYVPEYILTNHELEQMVDTSDEWITARFGIKERRILKGMDKGTSDLCTPVALEICERRGIRPDEIEVLILSTATPDRITPSTSLIVMNKIGARNAWGLDINAACSGFLCALDIGASFIESGRYKNVMVISGDKMSAVVDYTDRTTCVLFGDGAGGVLLEPAGNGYGVKDVLLRSDVSDIDGLHIKAGGSARPATSATVDRREHYVQMNGKTVLKYAIPGMIRAVQDLMARNQLQITDIDWLVPHQANKRILEMVARELGIPQEKVMMNIHRYGNTSAGTVPLCLWDYRQQLKKGDKLVLVAIGAGFIWGASYITWGL